MKVYQKKIGIIGGGQIAKLLAERAHQMGFHIIILSEDKSDPAVQMAHQWIKGSPHKPSDLQKLATLSDIVTYESEHLDFSHLNELSQKKSHLEIFPTPKHLHFLQDRWSQKELLWDYKIPTAEFVKINSKDEFNSALKIFKKLVIKKRRGKTTRDGLIYIQNQDELQHFLLTHKNKETQYIAEKCLSFKNEKTLIMARSSHGEIFAYPLIHIENKNNQCYRVWGPEKHSKYHQLVEKMSFLLHEIQYVGLITIELLDTGSELMVNQLIPRPHNAGYVTQDTFSLDQFELHIRAICGLKFPTELHSTPYFLMQNIIGHSLKNPHIEDGLNGKIHWYHKKNNKPLKKLGHLNYFGSSLKKLTQWADMDLKKILTSIMIVFLFSSCNVKTGSSSSSESYTYQFVVNNCDTTKHSYSSREEMCDALNDHAGNYYCAYNERYQKFLTDCADRTWSQ